MTSKFRTKPNYDERFQLVIPRDLKQRLFDAAKERDVSASALIRRAVMAAVDGEAA